MSDTRKDKRAPVALKVRFKSATVDEFMEQYARDISRGGLFIKSKSPMPVGTLLKFEVQLKDESPVIRGVGRVVWKREPQEAAGNDAPSGMGIKFIRMDAECRAFVEKIVTQRGDVPGQFEAGGHSEESVPPPPARPSTKSERPRQITAPFFPAAGPSESELPLPEDRTQVRHASEFLASALAEVGDTEAAREAERKAEEARRRSEEIERQRARESERPKPEPVTKAPSSSPPPASDLRSSSIPPAAAPPSTPPAAETPLEADTKPDAPNPAPEKREPSKRIPVAARDLVDDRPPPVEEPNSYLVPAIIGVAAVIAIGYFAVSFGGGGSDERTHETPHTAQPSTAREVPPDEPTSEPNTPSELPEPAADFDENPSEIAELPPTEPAPAETPVPSVRVRIETAPPGAIITIDGSERGASPVDIEAPIGTALTISARLAGHRIATQEITPSRSMRPVRMQLAALPYVIEVSTSPLGARVRAGGQIVHATGPSSRVSIPRPSRPVQVAASLAGHLDASQTVNLDSFTERDGEMVAAITLTLRERPAPVRPPPTTSPAPRPTPTEPTTPSAAAPETEASAEEAAAAPPPPPPPPPPVPEERPSRPPEPEPEAEEAPPENPF